MPWRMRRGGPVFRKDPPNPKYFRAQKFTFYLLCSASALVFVILFIILGFLLVADPPTRTQNAYIWELTFALSTITQLLGIYAVWKDNIIACWVHVAFCVAVTFPYKMHHDLGHKKIPIENLIGLLVFLFSALLQFLLVRDFIWLKKHPNNESGDPSPQNQNANQNSEYFAIKKWILLIGCSLTSIVGFSALGIFAFLVKPDLQKPESLYFGLILLAGSVCQIVGFLGAWFERLLFVIAHIVVCLFVTVGFGVFAFQYQILNRTASSAIFGLFWFSALISLSFASDLNRKRKNYSTPSDNVELNAPLNNQLN